MHLELTPDEARALLDASYYVTGGYGPPPSPPTPAMSAQAKLQTILEGAHA